MRALLPLCALALVFAIAPSSSRATPVFQTPPPPIDDALIAPPPLPRLDSAADDLRGPSQYLAGRVAVRLVLPESDGGAEPSSEQWTGDEIAHVTAQVRSALDWWDAQLPLAGLEFVLQVDLAPTAYEPIMHGLADESLWIGDAMRRLGFDGPSHFEQLYAAGDAHRRATGADWTTTIFIVDSSAHQGGHFADGRFAYAYINGPHMVLTSDVGGYGPERLAPIVAHELGHSFGALDQYAVARIPCERRSGYLNAPTSNSQYGGCGGREPSIMLEPLSAFAAGRVDPSARAQVGYSDGDGDGLIDPLDTAPTLALSEGRLAVGSARPLLSGSAQDLPFPSPTHQRVTLNRIAGAEYRVNGGPWLPLPAADGAYDQPGERFAVELPLYNGVYTIEARARNSAGAVSSVATRVLSISWIGPQPDYRLSLPELVNDPQLALHVAAPADTAGVQVSADPAFTGAEWQPLAGGLSYLLPGGDGARSLYVRFKDWAGLESLPFGATVTLDTVAPSGVVVRDPADPSGYIIRAYDATAGLAAIELRVGEGSPVSLPFAERLNLGASAAGEVVSLRLRDRAGNLSPAIVAPARYQVALPSVAR